MKRHPAKWSRNARNLYKADVLACWCYWEALRRIGFSSDDIFVSVYHEVNLGFEVCGVELHAQGLKFIINAARLTRPSDEFRADWISFCEDVLAERIDSKILMPVWDRRPADIGQLPAGLVYKGFWLPSSSQKN